jgi:uncharacterized protein (TIGR00725 family)
MIRNLIGVMGPGETASMTATTTAYALGQAIAQQGWGLLTGGRAVGVMEAASQGARSVDGIVIGILPGETMEQMSSAVDIPIVTGLGNGRNVINVLSSQVVVACGLGPGTLSEMALAVKLRKPLIGMHMAPEILQHLQALARSPVWPSQTVEEAITHIHEGLGDRP